MFPWHNANKFQQNQFIIGNVCLTVSGLNFQIQEIVDATHMPKRTSVTSLSPQQSSPPTVTISMADDASSSLMAEDLGEATGEEDNKDEDKKPPEKVGILSKVSANWRRCYLRLLLYFHGAETLILSGNNVNIMGAEALAIILTMQDIWGLWCQKQVSQAGINSCIPQYSVGCNYLSMPEIPGGRLNIKMSSYQYRDPHVKDKTVSPTILSLT